MIEKQKKGEGKRQTERREGKKGCRRLSDGREPEQTRKNNNLHVDKQIITRADLHTDMRASTEVHMHSYAATGEIDTDKQSIAARKGRFVNDIQNQKR